jgi:hypothetical protein
MQELNDKLAAKYGSDAIINIETGGITYGQNTNVPT